MTDKFAASGPGRNWWTVAAQLIRYGISGGIASIANIGIYWIATARFGWDPNLAWTLGFVAAVLLGYIVHSRWSFRGHGRRDNLMRTGSRFLVVALISFGINSLWVWLLVQHWKLPVWAPYPLVLGITPLFMFWLNRRWVFE